MKLSPDLERACLALAGATGEGPTKKRKDIPNSITPPRWAVEFEVPIRLANEMNAGGPLGAKLSRKRKVKAATIAAIPPHLPPPPVRVTLTRLGGQKRMDPDGWTAAVKWCQDRIAAALGVDDGDRDRVTWRYRQRPAYGACRVLVRIETA